MAPMAGVLGWEDRGSLGRIGKGRRGGRITLCVGDQLECVELCVGMDEEPQRVEGPGLKGRQGRVML